MVQKISRESYLELLKTAKKNSWLSYKKLEKLTKRDASYLHRVITGKIKNPGMEIINIVFKILNKHQIIRTRDQSK